MMRLVIIGALLGVASEAVRALYRRWWVDGSPPWADPLPRGPRTPWGEAGFDGTPWQPTRDQLGRL